MVTLRLVADDRPDPLPEPYPHECVACFVDRMTRIHGCTDRLTWAARWRDRCAPRATALERRLRAKGGYCDCEMLMNVYVRREWPREQWAWAVGEEDDDPIDPDPDGEPPVCFGVRKGSSQPCAQWLRPYV